MTREEAGQQARSLRSHIRMARAALREHGPTWTDYDRILEIAEEMEAEAIGLERLEDA